MVQTINKRLKYLDAARGLAIFTVVYSHICLFCIPEYSATSAIIDILRIYFLNGFFFISGFLAYKNDCFASAYLNLAWKRAYQLLIPALIVGVVYSITHGITVKAFIFDEAVHNIFV